jgi:5-methylcytosine-specific restriction endonuclease McrA
MALDKLNSGKYKAQRQRVFKRDGHVCAYCGIDEGVMHIDHIIPRKVGGDHAMENLQVLCKSCNQAKAAKSEGVFLAQTATPPVFSGVPLPETVMTKPPSPFEKP